MRLTSIALAAVAASLMIVPSAFAMDKMDGDAWLKMVFHGKPGDMMTMPAMAPMAPMKPMKMAAMDMSKMPMMKMPDMMMKKPMMSK